jgi:hypothetical protein
VKPFVTRLIADGANITGYDVTQAANAERARRYSVAALPTLLVFDAAEQPVRRFVGNWNTKTRGEIHAVLFA